MIELGKRLRTLRLERGFTQEYLSDLLKIPQASYSKLENNKGKIDVKVLKKIADLYEIDLVELFKTEHIINNNQTDSNSSNLIFNQLSQKLIEQYENRILELKEMNLFLLSQLKKVTYFFLAGTSFFKINNSTLLSSALPCFKDWVLPYPL
jgi:transcriptional regulator with XRE-family HTH domain